MKFRILALIIFVLLFASAAQSQLVEEFDQEDNSCCLPIFAQRLVNQLQDWNQLSRYQDDNVALRKKPYDSERVVFMGDSITDFWKLAEYFPGKPYVNRGISGQTTPQMLVRMYPDVVVHKPAAMVVLAGINDVSQNTGPATAEMVEHNIMAMTDIAIQNGIKVVLCSVLPVNDYVILSTTGYPQKIYDCAVRCVLSLSDAQLNVNDFHTNNGSVTLKDESKTAIRFCSYSQFVEQRYLHGTSGLNKQATSGQRSGWNRLR